LRVGTHVLRQGMSVVLARIGQRTGVAVHADSLVAGLCEQLRAVADAACHVDDTTTRREGSQLARRPRIPRDVVAPDALAGRRDLTLPRQKAHGFAVGAKMGVCSIGTILTSVPAVTVLLM